MGSCRNLQRSRLNKTNISPALKRYQELDERQDNISAFKTNATALTALWGTALVCPPLAPVAGLALIVPLFGTVINAIPAAFSTASNINDRINGRSVKPVRPR